jgi:hypothetical protein
VQDSGRAQGSPLRENLPAEMVGFRRAAAFGLNLPMYCGIIEPEAHARSREGVDIPAPVERLERGLK